MKYPSYLKMKDTCVEWLGEIPEHWDIVRLKWCLELNDGGIWGDDLKDDDEGITVLRSTEINFDGSWSITNPAKRKISNNNLNEYLLKEGDLLITKSSGSEKHIGKTAIVTREVERLNCTFSNFMQRLRPKSFIHPKFLFYFINSKIGREQLFYYSMTTTGLKNLSSEGLGKVIFIETNYREQKTIAKFLDKETERIDKLIEKKEKLIELLEEKRQAVISNAVTKGLDHNIPMKDSGFEWLGKIPKHWIIKPLKYCTKINKQTLSEKTSSDKVIKYIDIGSVNQTGEITKIQKLTFGKAPSRARRIIKMGDTILSTVRTYLKAVAYFEEVNNDIICSTGFAVLTPNNEFAQKFLYYWVRSTQFIEEVVARSVGVSYPAINISELGVLPCIIPPKKEQIRIINYIDKIICRIDKLKERIYIQIYNLKKYRQALITNAVTGKIDVRNLA